MDFFEAISSGLSNYVNFRTRAIRSEYWYWVLFAVIISVAAIVIDMVVFNRMGGGEGGPISILAGLALLLPGIAVSIRRLHDGDKSGWWLFIAFVPLIGGLLLLVWVCSRGTIGPNRFGPDPLEGRY